MPRPAGKVSAVHMGVSADQLKQVVEEQHGGKAVRLTRLTVKDTFEGRTVWEGVVHIFDLEGHPTATRAYAWSSQIEGTNRWQVYALLHLGHIRSPVDAIRAARATAHRDAAAGAVRKRRDAALRDMLGMPKKK